MSARASSPAPVAGPAATETAPAAPRAAVVADADLLEAIFREHGEVLRRIALRMTGSEDDADDVVQEVLLSLPAALGTFRGRGSLRGWLGVVAARRALMLLRRRRRLRECPFGVDAHSAIAAADPVLERVDAERLLARLPAPYRAVVQLWAVEGYTHEEIGRQLGIGREGSKTRLHRARKLIRSGEARRAESAGPVRAAPGRGGGGGVARAAMPSGHE